MSHLSLSDITNAADSRRWEIRSFNNHRHKPDSNNLDLVVFISKSRNNENLIDWCAHKFAVRGHPTLRVWLICLKPPQEMIPNRMNSSFRISSLASWPQMFGGDMYDVMRICCLVSLPSKSSFNTLSAGAQFIYVAEFPSTVPPPESLSYRTSRPHLWLQTWRNFFRSFIYTKSLRRLGYLTGVQHNLWWRANCLQKDKRYNKETFTLCIHCFITLVTWYPTKQTATFSVVVNQSMNYAPFLGTAPFIERIC